MRHAAKTLLIGLLLPTATLTVVPAAEAQSALSKRKAYSLAKYEVHNLYEWAVDRWWFGEPAAIYWAMKKGRQNACRRISTLRVKCFGGVWAENLEDEDGRWGGENDYGHCRATIFVTKYYDAYSSRPAYRSRASNRTLHCFRRYER